jgi:peptidoglycan hydrolase CwlO-like protein
MQVPNDLQGIVIWILMAALTLCFAGLTFFVRRFIQTNDEHHTGVNTKLASLETVIEDNGRLVTSTIGQVNVIAAQMEKSATVFQRDLNKELHDVHKSVTEIRANVSTMQSAIVGVQEQIIKHQHSISAGAKGMAKLREDVDGIKSTVKRLSYVVEKKCNGEDSGNNDS